MSKTVRLRTAPTDVCSSWDAPRDRFGRVVDDVGVSIGPVRLSNVKVGVGISASDENEALLGQSFLSKFDITISKNQMVLRSHDVAQLPKKVGQAMN